MTPLRNQQNNINIINLYEQVKYNYNNYQSQPVNEVMEHKFSVSMANMAQQLQQQSELPKCESSLLNVARFSNNPALMPLAIAYSHSKSLTAKEELEVIFNSLYERAKQKDIIAEGNYPLNITMATTELMKSKTPRHSIDYFSTLTHFAQHADDFTVEQTTQVIYTLLDPLYAIHQLTFVEMPTKAAEKIKYKEIIEPFFQYLTYESVYFYFPVRFRNYHSQNIFIYNTLPSFEQEPDLKPEAIYPALKDSVEKRIPRPNPLRNMVSGQNPVRVKPMQSINKTHDNAAKNATSLPSVLSHGVKTLIINSVTPNNTLGLIRQEDNTGSPASPPPVPPRISRSPLVPSQNSCSSAQPLEENEPIYLTIIK